MSDDSDDSVITPDKPTIPEFPADRFEANEKPTIPTFPTDRIEKGEKPESIRTKED